MSKKIFSIKSSVEKETRLDTINERILKFNYDSDNEILIHSFKKKGVLEIKKDESIRSHSLGRLNTKHFQSIQNMFNKDKTAHKKLKLKNPPRPTISPKKDIILSIESSKSMINNTFLINENEIRINESIIKLIKFTIFTMLRELNSKK